MSIEKRNRIVNQIIEYKEDFNPQDWKLIEELINIDSDLLDKQSNNGNDKILSDLRTTLERVVKERDNLEDKVEELEEEIKKLNQKKEFNLKDEEIEDLKSKRTDYYKKHIENIIKDDEKFNDKEYENMSEFLLITKDLIEILETKLKSQPNTKKEKGKSYKEIFEEEIAEIERTQYIPKFNKKHLDESMKRHYFNPKTKEKEEKTIKNYVQRMMYLQLKEPNPYLEKYLFDFIKKEREIFKEYEVKEEI